MTNFENIKPDKILQWFINRLKFRYSEKEEKIIQSIKHINDNFYFIPKKLDDQKLEDIGRKFYFDWDIPGSEINIGMSYIEKQKTKDFIKELISYTASL